MYFDIAKQKLLILITRDGREHVRGGLSNCSVGNAAVGK